MVNLIEIAKRQLKDIIARGKGTHMMNCPCHDDKKASLAVFVDENGRVSFYCHALCDKDDIIDELELDPEDLQGFNEPEIIARYPYIDLHGNIIHETVRLPDKEFRQRRPDTDPNSDNEYIWNLQGVQTLLYRLPEVVKGIKDGERILLVEGEKDALNLSKLGFVSTTAPMGSKGFKKHHAEMLKDGNIYIIPDNDDAGRSYSKKVAKLLLDKAKSIHIVDLSAELPELGEKGDATDFFQLLGKKEGVERFERALENAVEYPVSRDDKDSSDKSTKKDKRSNADILLDLVLSEDVRFLHTEIEELFAVIPVNGRKELRALDSKNFKSWLFNLFYDKTRKTIGNDAISQVINVLSGIALYKSGEPVELHTRVAGNVVDENITDIYYDLTDKEWRVVHITPKGWKIINSDEIMFNRYRHQAEQVEPSLTSSNLNKVLDYINIKKNKTLFLVWLVSCFIPEIVHAATIIYGNQGSAKTTACRLLKSLIDPSLLGTLTLKSGDSLNINFQQHWYVPFDNISHISPELSDMLCKSITGEGLQVRKLFTNGEDHIFFYKRIISLNGINVCANRPDLLQRSILIELSPIPDTKRRLESEVYASFERDRPQILAGIFDTVSRAMDIYPTSELHKFPRLADFCKWGYAIAEGIQKGLGEEFLEELESNTRDQNLEAINSDPVASLIVHFMSTQKTWEGTVTKLYNALRVEAVERKIELNKKFFPGDAVALGKHLRRIITNLEGFGINLTVRSKNIGSWATLTRVKSHQHPPHIHGATDNKVSDDACGDGIEASGSRSVIQNRFPPKSIKQGKEAEVVVSTSNNTEEHPAAKYDYGIVTYLNSLKNQEEA